MYIKNIENGEPDYKDSLNCFSFGDLDRYTKTTKRTHQELWEKAKTQGSTILSISNKQNFLDKVELIKDCKNEIIGNNWFSKALLDEAFSEHSRYPLHVGWHECPRIKEIRNNLQFLVDYFDFIIIYDENEVNRYERDCLYPKIVYENRKFEIGFIISIDNKDGYLSLDKYKTNKTFFHRNKFKKQLKPEYFQDDSMLKEIIMKEIKNSL